MEHAGEFWQEYDYCGKRILDEHGITPGAPVKNYFAGVAIMLYRFKNGEVEYLFQHRAKNLRGNPDKWDVSAGGHINYNEPKLDSAIRETKEEIGVELHQSKLEFAASYIITTNNGITNLYFYDYQDCEDNFYFDDQEVEEVKWIKYSDIKNFQSNLKPQLKSDEIFFIMLKRWAAKIQEKYGNHQP